MKKERSAEINTYSDKHNLNSRRFFQRAAGERNSGEQKSLMKQVFCPK